MIQNIKSQISELISSVEDFLQNESNLEKISDISEIVTDAFRSGKKVFFCGNGGSASEAQHLAAELSGKFKIDRKPLPAEACHINPSFITAVSNDFSFEKSFERYIEAFANKGDILFGLSTSGNSVNVIRAFQKSQETGIITVALTGKSGGKLKDFSKYILNVPSEDVARIQEMHLLIGHIICETVEKELFTNAE